MALYYKQGDNTSYIDAIEVTPTITSGSAYSTGHQLGSLQTITGATRLRNGKCILQSVTILDKAKQSAAIDIVFFSASPTFSSTDRTAFDISDANLHTYIIGAVNCAETYLSFNINSMQTKAQIGLPLSLGANSRTIYAIPVIRATATYASTTDLKFIYGFLQD